MTDVQVGRCRIEAELHAELIPNLKPIAQMLLDVDLDRPLAQALEELPAHAPMR